MNSVTQIACSAELSAHEERVNHVAFSPGGEHMASSDVGSNVVVWRGKTPAHRFRLASRLRPWMPNVVRSLAFSADGSELYVAAAEKIRAFDVRNGQVRWCSRAPNMLAFLPNSPQAIAVCSGGDWVATFASGLVEQWTTYRARKARWTHNDTPRTIAILGDGKRLVGTNGYTVTMWDLETHAMIGRMDVGERVLGFAASPIRDVAALHFGTFVQILDLAENREIGAFRTPPGLPALAFSPREERIAVAEGKSVLLRDFSGRPAAEAAQSDAVALSLGYDANGRTLATGRSDGVISIWNVER